MTNTRIYPRSIMSREIRRVQKLTEGCYVRARVQVRALGRTVEFFGTAVSFDDNNYTTIMRPEGALPPLLRKRFPRLPDGNICIATDSLAPTAPLDALAEATLSDEEKRTRRKEPENRALQHP